MLLHADCEWTVVSLCRGSDPDRAPRFARAMGMFGATFAMGDLDDGPTQEPLPPASVAEAVLGLAPARRFTVVLTHSLRGEYTRHRRHEEVGRAVGALWLDGGLAADALWQFAYDDGGGGHMPRAIAGAHLVIDLPAGVAAEKRRIIREVYGFGEDSFEARTTPPTEAFWCFGSAAEYERWHGEEGLPS